MQLDFLNLDLPFSQDRSAPKQNPLATPVLSAPSLVSPRRNLRTVSRGFDSNRGLTLVEIIVVLIILSIVITFVSSRVFGAGDKAKADITKLKLKEIKSSIEQFQLRYNQLPNSLEDLLSCNEITGPGCVPITNQDSLKDAWGGRILYSKDGDGRRYRIKTLGADGKEGGEGVNYDSVEEGP